MTDLQRQRLVATAAGGQCVQDDDFEQAVFWFTQALQCCDELAHDGAADTMLQRAQVVAALSGALFELGRWGEAEQALSTTLALLEGSAGAGSTASRVVTASLRLNLAAARMVSGQLPLAQPQLLAVADLLQGTGADVLLARAQILLGAALSATGQPLAALDHLAAAATTLDRPEHEDRIRLRGALHVNTGYAFIVLGRYDEACRSFGQGITTYDGLILAGREARRPDRARSLMNLGSAHVRAGRPQQALPTFTPALADCDAALRDARQPAAAVRLRATRGAILMNWGYCLFLLGQDGAAEQALARAARSHAALVRTHPHLSDDLARTWVNQAHLAARASRLRRAGDLYEKGMSALGAALEERPYLHSEHANAALGLARVRVLQGRTQQAAALFETAMQTLCTLSRSGQLPLAWAWLEAWNAQLSALLKREITLRQSRPGAAGGADALAHRQTLLRVLAQPPRRALGDGSVPLQALQVACALIEEWSAAATSAEPAGAVRNELMAAYLAHVVGCLGDVLADSEPGWLAQHVQPVQQVMAHLRDMAAAQPLAAQALADWFLHTRGLRAQRSALTQGEAAELVALKGLLRDLRRLEDEMLGEARAAASAPAHESRAPGLLAPPLNRPTPAQERERAASWQALHDRVEGLRQQLVDSGHLPATFRLGAAGVAACLAPHSALILLARHDTRRVLAIVLQRPGAGPVATSHVLVEQHPDLQHFSFAALLGLARHALGQGTRGNPLRGAAGTTTAAAAASLALSSGELDLFALDLFASVWQRTVLPLLQALTDQACMDVCLVPSDELHLMPWTHFAETSSPPGCSVEIYPSCGAWARCRTSAAAEPRAAPRWALAAWSGLGTGRPLPWVEVERLLSARLWRAVSGEPELLCGARPSADDVGAFIGMGHGSVRNDNPAQAGLTLADGVVLSAHDLHQVRNCRRVMLSACVLGCIDEAFGEPLGFLSGCFDYRTCFGTGWLTEVPDAAACWASMALQFALRQAYAAPDGGPVVWSRVTRQARRQMLAGAWPDGLGDWLASEVPLVLAELNAQGGLPEPLVFDPGLALAPPAALRRVLPWAVAFGH